MMERALHGNRQRTPARVRPEQPLQRGTPPSALLSAWIAATLAVYSLTSCAASGPGAVTRHEHTVSGRIELDASQYRVWGYDPNDPRLLRVTDELERLYGRPIVLRFATEMMPRDEAFFEHLFESELGKLPRVMQAWQRSETAAFADMTADLQHIDFDFDGALPEPFTEFGKEPGRLRFVLNSWDIPEKLVQRAMFGANRRWLTRHYLERTPEQIAPNERVAYLDALIHNGADFAVAKAPQVQSEVREPSAGRADVMLLTLRLAAVARNDDSTLTQAVTERLIDDGRYLRDCYENHPEFVRRVPQSSVWINAEKQWLDWAREGLRTLPGEARYSLLETILVPSDSTPRLAQHARAFAGFDVVDFGFQLMNDWAKAGHPSAAGQREVAADPKVRIYDRVLCPSLPDERGLYRQRAKNCRPTFYATALTDEKGRARLQDEIVGAADPNVRRLLSTNLLELTRSHWSLPKATTVPTVMALWRRLEPHRAEWAELARLLALEIDASNELREALYDQTTRYYRERPADRGVLLFLLARIDGYGRTPVAWKNFGPTYGAKISAAELATFLDQSTFAFEELRDLVPALDDKASPGKVVAFKLRAYLDSPLGPGDLQRKGSILGGIGSELAGAGDLEGVESMRRELLAYIGNDPGRERQLRDAAEGLRTLLARP